MASIGTCSIRCFWATNKNGVARQVSVDDASSCARLRELDANPPWELSDLRSVEVIDTNNMKSVLRPKFRGPHPLRDLIGVRCRFRKQQMERFRNHRHTSFMRQYEVVLINPPYVISHPTWRRGSSAVRH